ncbi:MAG: Beta-barrel assembly-enhancing protease [Alphaproteobacteria bacterium MarineAlpha5_Bin9]|nr:MAG: Beta-barrel assembly-enhancing protease [Alphaproteobacteria bacterium MarineAlpha5_Bin9]|tara:strand:- start:2031 stop:3857 length:1827 start_codon:yes stop_codon:yes gene_type:complete
MSKVNIPNIEGLSNVKEEKDKLSRISTFMQQGDLYNAEIIINDLIKDNPNNYVYKNILSIILVSQKKFDEAVIVLKEIVELNPNYIDALINLGNISLEKNNLDDADYYYKESLKKSPKNKLALFNLATVYEKKEKFNQSAQLFVQLMKIEPNNIELLNRYGVNQSKLGFFDEAEEAFNKMLKIRPNYLPAIINLGTLNKDLKRYNKAESNFLLALKIQPNFPIVLYNLGTVYEEQEKYLDAIKQYKLAIEADPKYAQAYFNLGCVQGKIGQTHESIISYNNAIKYNPKHSKTKYNLGMAQLAVDDFEKGWKGYELRKVHVIEKFYKFLKIPQEKIWDGKKLQDPLVVHSEQGIGEEVLFSSMFKDVYDFQDNLYITANPRIINIFKRSFPKINFINNKDKEYVFDKNSKHILAGSLGAKFRKNINDFQKPPQSWLLASPEKIKLFSGKINKDKRIKIGIAWKTAGINSTIRYIPLSDIVKIFPQEKFEIINLQYGDIKKDLNDLKKAQNRELIYFDDLDYTNDIEGLAALISNCDLVVSIGSFTASFSGSLGKKTWVLLAAFTDWCWHSNTNRSESLWFPNMKFFRQKSLNVWDDVVENLDKEAKLLK